MRTEDTLDVTVEIEDEEVVLHEVPFAVEVRSDPGCRTLPNGDPGVPPSSEVDITLGWSTRELFAVASEEASDRFLFLPVSSGQLLRAVEDAIEGMVR